MARKPKTTAPPSGDSAFAKRGSPKQDRDHTSERTNSISAEGEAPPTYTMQSPLFGKCYLRPRPLGAAPAGIGIGYVELVAKPGNLMLAIYHNDQWQTRKLKPFGDAIARWYSVETADGAPVL